MLLYNPFKSVLNFSFEFLDGKYWFETHYTSVFATDFMGRLLYWRCHVLAGEIYQKMLCCFLFIHYCCNVLPQRIKITVDWFFTFIPVHTLRNFSLELISSQIQRLFTFLNLGRRNSATIYTLACIKFSQVFLAIQT